MRRFVLPILVVFALVTSALAQQPAPLPKLTWIRYYTVQPGKGDTFVRLMRQSSQKMFDELLAGKKVQAWGIVVPMTHTDETWTHAIYITMDDWASVESLVRAVEAADTSSDAALEATLVSGSIRDVVLRHIIQSEAPPKAAPKYIDVSTYVVKPGRANDAVALYREWAVPMLTAAAMRGNVGPWGLSSQAIDTNGSWTHMTWTFLSDLNALGDRETDMMALPANKLMGYDVRLRDLSEPEKHREQILRVIYAAP
ncbi:MAG TPA: hypothetical protein VFN10_01450 [Thermoanaerobaculia bacterium]|nr:hypothetical protein [Thermoanaerobaculia bacterium]